MILAIFDLQVVPILPIKFRVNRPFASGEEVGVVGWCEGVVYLASPGRPTDIGSQLGMACYPFSR